jgi:hypothetical protein
VGHRFANLHFTPGAKRPLKYLKYLEAWHLLLHGARPKDDGPIDIQACGGEVETVADRKPGVVQARLALRGMFRRNVWGSKGAQKDSQ